MTYFVQRKVTVKLREHKYVLCFCWEHINPEERTVTYPLPVIIVERTNRFNYF